MIDYQKIFNYWFRQNVHALVGTADATFSDDIYILTHLENRLTSIAVYKSVVFKHGLIGSKSIYVPEFLKFLREFSVQQVVSWFSLLKILIITDDYGHRILFK